MTSRSPLLFSPCSLNVLSAHAPILLSFAELSTRNITNPGTWRPSPWNPCSFTPHTTRASRGIWVTQRPRPSGTMRQWPPTGTGPIPGSPGSKVTSTAMPRTQRPCRRQPPWTLCLRGMSYEVSGRIHHPWFFSRAIHLFAPVSFSGHSHLTKVVYCD